MPALTRDRIRKARSGEREHILWDTTNDKGNPVEGGVAGFGVRVLPGGSRSFFLQFRARDGERLDSEVGGRISFYRPFGAWGFWIWPSQGLPPLAIDGRPSGAGEVPWLGEVP